MLSADIQTALYVTNGTVRFRRSINHNEENIHMSHYIAHKYVHLNLRFKVTAAFDIQIRYFISILTWNPCNFLFSLAFFLFLRVTDEIKDGSENMPSSEQPVLEK